MVFSRIQSDLLTKYIANNEHLQKEVHRGECYSVIVL